MEIIMKRVLLPGAVLALLALSLLTTMPASAAKEGEDCAGIAGILCDDGLFCEFAAGRCGVADDLGKCEMVPGACTQDIAYVCGCDGMTYSNDCRRKMAKVGKNHDGKCEKAE
jgi:hypothetical protein